MIEEIRLEFVAAAKALQRTDDEIARVWELVGGFRGYAFCRAHSTAYGVEAYQGAYLKHYHPAEFLASVLSSGKASTPSSPTPSNAAGSASLSFRPT